MGEQADPASLVGQRLWGGFIVISLEFSNAPLLDAIGRHALARTGIVGIAFDLVISAGLSEKELSVTLYHEILEAASLAVRVVPASTVNFNEADFDAAAYRIYGELGHATLETVNRMLQIFGFRES